MNEIQFRQLLENYLAGNLSSAERQKFFELLEQEQFRKIVENMLEEDWKEGRYEEEDEKIYSVLEKLILSRIETNSQPYSTQKGPRILRMRLYKIVAAAVLVVAIGSAVWFYSRTEETKQTAAKAPVDNRDVAPGSEGAVLTLENGKQIILDSVNTGIVATQSGSSIIKGQGGLHYNSDNTNALPVFNTISTSRGKQYSNLVLSDGTKVWLDASSSIRFPVAFVGNERKVEITGQAWFEVVHKPKMPFKVIAKGLEVTDIGTQFNVKAYDDESVVKVTLLQGVVKVQNTLLNPGEQALVANGGNLKLEKQVDLEEVTAWKNGRFVFNDAGIEQVMQDLARWYDLDVVYTDTIKERFHLEITRNTNLSNVLKIMQATGAVHFKIDGKKITVMP